MLAVQRGLYSICRRFVATCCIALVTASRPQNTAYQSRKRSDGLEALAIRDRLRYWTGTISRIRDRLSSLVFRWE